MPIRIRRMARCCGFLINAAKSGSLALRKEDDDSAGKKTDARLEYKSNLIQNRVEIMKNKCIEFVRSVASFYVPSRKKNRTIKRRQQSAVI